MSPLGRYLGASHWLELSQWQALAGPVLILLVMSMLILPLPPLVLDLLFTFNIALSVMVLLVSMFTLNTLEFAAFPSLLLFTTLLRLSLNVASTRIVLMEGHNGGDAAGKIIEAFGQFLVGGNFAVGLVVFIILVLINFMVITKGAGRIAEVGARFMLDAMPGKQMAIDADLNAGLIGEDDARARRAEIAKEADFYGSMDGASKFVRGDAIAGLLIMAINLVGGLLIGSLQHDMPLADAAQTYTLLTIGDGLVAQIPALVISTAAGVMVARVNTGQDIGQQMLGQFAINPKALALTALVIGLLGLAPGMPGLVFFLFASLLGALAWWGLRHEATSRPETVIEPEAPAAPEPPEASWDDVQLIDPIGLEVGLRLVPLVDDRQNGELLRRIKSVRKKIARDLGFLPPLVRIRDNLAIDPNGYTISLKGAEIGRGEAMVGKWLAIDPGGAAKSVEGVPTRDPTFGLPALWIELSQKERAQLHGYTVVDAATVVATHVDHILRTHAAELLTRREVRQLLERISKDDKEYVEDVVPKLVSVAQFQRLLQRLLEENVPIRDLSTILDTVAEHGAEETGIEELLAHVRVALGRLIVSQCCVGDGELRVLGFDPSLERVLTRSISQGEVLEPGLGEALLHQVGEALSQQESAGDHLVLVVAHPLRSLVARFLRRQYPQLTVLSHLEIPADKAVRVTKLIGGTE